MNCLKIARACASKLSFIVRRKQKYGKREEFECKHYEAGSDL